MSDRSGNQYHKRRNIWRGIAAGLIFVSFIALVSDGQQKILLASGRIQADGASAKVMEFLATPVRGIQAMFTNLKNRTNIIQKNASMKAELARIRPYETKALDLEMRIQSLEKILHMETSSDIPTEKIIARAVSEIHGLFAYTSLINVGYNQGVLSNHPVMTVDGLYGHVVRSGANSARVLLLNDMNSRIAVMSQRSKSRALMVGANDKRPKLEYISPKSDWKIGDRIVTSGDGGVLPQGLAIGTYTKYGAKKTGVQLYTRGKPVDWVWVYPYKPIPAPIENGSKADVSINPLADKLTQEGLVPDLVTGAPNE
ncbi:MAG: rod shape-determining protein MreC [Robiginitomaculum sp.]